MFAAPLPVLITLKIGDKCYDLPKNMPIPNIGDMVFIGSIYCTIKSRGFHIINGEAHMVALVGTKIVPVIEQNTGA